MMRIQVYVQQKKADPLYRKAMEEYLKRLGAYASVSVTYLKNEKQMQKKAAGSRKKFFVACGKKTMTNPEFARIFLSAERHRLIFLLGNSRKKIWKYFGFLLLRWIRL